MKRTLFLAIALTVALTAGAKDKVVKNPVFARGRTALTPRTVTLGKTCTTVSFRYMGGGWSLSAEAHLEAEGKTYRMIGGTVYTKQEDGTRGAGEPIDPAKHYNRANDSLVLVFEPLDPGIKLVDFIEE